MITRIYKAKILVNIFHVIENANPIGQHVIQIKNGMIVNVNESLKNIAHSKKININGILAHVIVSIVSI